jgi:RimJ/RimL family protein N-acetyltransferase
MNLKYINHQIGSFVQEGAVGYAHVNYFPGDTEIGVINGVYIPVAEQGKGVGSKQHAERLQLMKDMGFLHAMCTVNKGNEKEITILKRHGWEKIKELEYTSVWIKNLQE